MENRKQHIALVLGERIRKARKSKSLTHDELAQKAHTNPNYISEIERGLKAPSHEKLLDITTAMDITLSELFDDFEKELSYIWG